MQKDIIEGDRKELRVLACGHHSSPHGEHTTGTAHWTDPDTSQQYEICWDCSHQREREGMAKADHWAAYLVIAVGAGFTVTDWPGSILGRVTGYTTSGRRASVRMYYVDVTAFDGSKWYGRSAGAGMICQLHRRKAKRRTA